MSVFARRGCFYRAVALRPDLRERLAVDEEIERLGDVGRVIADALEILRHEEKMRAGGDVARVLDHVGEELAEKARIHLIELFVAQPDRKRLLGVALDIGVEDILDHRLAY